MQIVLGSPLRGLCSKHGNRKNIIFTFLDFLKNLINIFCPNDLGSKVNKLNLHCPHTGLIEFFFPLHNLQVKY